MSNLNKSKLRLDYKQSSIKKKSNQIKKIRLKQEKYRYKIQDRKQKCYSEINLVLKRGTINEKENDQGTMKQFSYSRCKSDE